MFEEAAPVVRRAVMAGEVLKTGLMGDAERHKIKLADYDPGRPEKFEANAKRQ
jgi:hypothetical protein